MGKMTVIYCSFEGCARAVVRILKAEYNRRSLLKPLLWENTIKLSLEDVYTRLRVISRRKTDFRLQHTKCLDMYDIFEDPGDVLALVEGSPGSGKTTFCLKLAHDWANAKVSKERLFSEFEIVLLLKCRDIDGDIMEAITDQLLPEGEELKKELMSYIQDIYNQETILIILDGLDELPQRAENHVDRLLDRRILPFCSILVTSRQEKGIEVRQNIDFDVLCHIEGFTRIDAFEYVRKHFRQFGPDHVAKGARLIQAIHRNPFLHALPSNPLNLLLLCVVFEDYEGDLPSGRTELYQIIVRCLLRRFCVKHDVEVPKDDDALEKQFEDSLLTLGELAWICLLEDRLSFREGELERFESVNKDLVARKLGLVFKESSLKRIKPQHEYHFLHKTFQEYLAALYLALKLLREGINVFDDFELNFFYDVAVKYRQVFLFVSGILGEEAVILFRQIGERLQIQVWDWSKCKGIEGTFFTESFSESRNSEQMAMTLCSFIPIPLTANVSSKIGAYDRTGDDYFWKGFFIVAKHCKNFSSFQHPTHLTVTGAARLPLKLDEVVDYLAYCPRLRNFSISTAKLKLKLALGVFQGLHLNSTLSSFTLKTVYSISPSSAVYVGEGLAACKTLETVTFELLGEWGESWANALERGLSANTSLKSVVLKIYGSMSVTATQALKRVLINTFVSSVVVVIYGEIQESVATAVGEGLALQTVLKSFTLILYGNLSQPGMSFLERGFLQNRSLMSLEVKVFGQLPNSWANVVENLISAKKSTTSFTFHPNIKGNITEAKVACVCPVLPKAGLHLEQSLNLWGELSCNGAEALGKLLLDPLPSRLTINIHGRVSDHVANSLVSYQQLHKTFSFITFNIWGEMTRDGKNAFEGLSSGSPNHHVDLNVHDVTPDYCPDGFDYCTEVPSTLTPVLTKVKTSATRELNLTSSSTGEDFGHVLGDGLTNNTSLTSLTLTVNNYSDKSGIWMQSLSDNLAKFTSLTTLSLTVNNYSGKMDDWTSRLGDGLSKNTSLLTLTLTINKDGDWIQSLGDGLARNTSLSTLSLIVNKGGVWMRRLSDGLAKNTSLTTLTLAVNNYRGKRGGWMRSLGNGLAENTSLTRFNLAVNNYNTKRGDWMFHLGNGFAKNTSLTTFALAVNNNKSGDWLQSLFCSLSENTSLTTLNLTVNKSGVWMRNLGCGLAKNKSLTTLALTVNCYSDHSGIWMRSLGDGVAENKSLTSFTLTVNNYSGESGDWMRSLGDGLAKNTSLTALTLTVDNYSDKNEVWIEGLSDGLANNTSLATLTLTVNNYSDKSRVWLKGLGVDLAKSRSLTTLSLTINSCSEVSRDRLHELCDRLAKSETLTTLRLSINDHSDASKGLGFDLSQCFVDCKSLTLLSLTESLYGEANVC